MTVPAPAQKSPARCPAAGSLRLALDRGFFLTCLEYRLPVSVHLRGETCGALRLEYEGKCEQIVVLARKRNRGFPAQRAIRSALSSMKRLFDASCPCDELAGEEAVNAWIAHMSRPRDTVPENLLRLLKDTARPLLAGWGSRLSAARAGGLRGSWEDPWSVPDQQGCFERTSMLGGTLSVKPESYSGDPSFVRVGVAKTKGKLRVVTMQSAEVKRVLGPVHTALYEHLSSYGWLVRGEVTKEDFRTVYDDLRPGEKLISGDYENATNNIKQPAVEALVEVISEDPLLTVEEKRMLIASFDGLRYKTCTRTGPINHGSMMGNLVSFPLLCILNKCIFDICSDIACGPGEQRKCRINGDDCLFAGSAEFYSLWRRMTSAYGLVVNEKKTSFTRSYAELNSRTWVPRTGRLVQKPVLSFLRRTTDTPECLFSGIFSGIGGWSRSSIWKAILFVKQELMFRCPSVNNIPSRWKTELFKRRWFRDCFRRDPVPLRERGVKRAVETVIGPPVVPHLIPSVEAWCDDCTRDTTAFWTGRKVRKYECRVDRSAISLKRLPPAFVSPGPVLWSYVYPKEVKEFLDRQEDRFPGRIYVSTSRRLRKWIEDSSLLTITPTIHISPLKSAKRALLFPPNIGPSILYRDFAIGEGYREWHVLGG